MNKLKNVLQTYYLDYFNNYLTLRKFAEDNELTIKDAEIIIAIGKDINNNIDYDYIEPDEVPF